MNEAPEKRNARTGWGLKGRLILSMLVVGVLPLFVGLVLAFLQGTREIQDVSGASFAGLATETARTLDLVLSDENDRLTHIATDVSIVAALEHRRDSRQGRTDEESSARLARTARAWETKDPATIQALTHNKLADILRRYYTGASVDPAHPMPVVRRSATRALFVTDAAGTLVASMDAGATYANAGATWWKEAYNKGAGKPYIGNVSFDDRVGVYTFTISLPIMDRLRSQVVGVAHRIFDAKAFFAPSTDTIRFGKTGHVMLIDSQGTVLSCPVLPTGLRLADAALIPLVTPPQPGWIKAPSDGHGGRGVSVIGFSPLPATSRITRASTGSQWHTFVWQSSAELFAPIQHLLLWISVFGAVAGGLLITLGYLAAGRIVGPIRRLKEAAMLIGRGELKDPIRIHTGDEIEDLAEEINNMNAQLEAAFAALTDQVEVKTREVQYLRKSTDQILDGVPTPIIMLDQEERAQYLNQASKEAFSLNRVDVTGARFLDLMRLDDPSRERLRRELHALSDQSDNGSDDLSLAPSTSAAMPIRDPLTPQPAPVPQPEQNDLYIGSRIYRYEWFRISGRPGEGQRIGLVLRDTTDESRLQDKVIQAEKLASLGVLGAGIGHELNNPLSGVIGLGEAIQEENDLRQVKSYAEHIVRHGKRMAAIIQDLAGLVRADSTGRPVPVDIQAELDQALQQARLGSEGAALEIRTNYRLLPKIPARPEDLRQAFRHVLTNAVQAMQGKGALTVATDVHEGQISVTIHDSGPGIPRPYLTKIFDPFFTTKEQGEGTGLGLTIARRLIMKYGGHIQIESEEGQGTTCLITFRVTGSSPEQGRPP